MKGHVLNPSNGFRTAFYDKKNGLWRQDSVSDMQLLQSEETPAGRPGKDIGKDGVRPDVYQVVSNNVEPVNEKRSDKPPKANPHYSLI